MAIDLIGLIAKFSKRGDVETERAFFRTKVPRVAPEAYLNIIYKPVDRAVVNEVSDQLRFPWPVMDFYHHWNGAHFFVNALSVFGCVPTGTALNRANRFMLSPFDVLETNRELRKRLSRTNLIALASYSFDGSLVCVERTSGETICFAGESVSSERMRWKSVDAWLDSEITRIAFLFDDDGNRLVGKDQLLPTSARIS